MINGTKEIPIPNMRDASMSPKMRVATDIGADTNLSSV